MEGLVVGGSKSLDKIPVLVGGNKNALDIVAAIVTVVASLQISRGGDTRTLGTLSRQIIQDKRVRLTVADERISILDVAVNGGAEQCQRGLRGADHILFYTFIIERIADIGHSDT